MEIIEVMEITLAVDAKEIDQGYPLDKDNLNLRNNYYSAVSRAMEYFHDFIRVCSQIFRSTCL